MDPMALKASTFVWWLVGPGRNDPTRESPWLGTAQIPSLHFVDAARATEQPDAFSAGRERFGPCSALLAGVEDDETEKDSPSAAPHPVYQSRIDRTWTHSLARPGSNQSPRLRAGRIPFRC